MRAGGEEAIAATFSLIGTFSQGKVDLDLLGKRPTERARTLSRPVTPYDVAPTLANYLCIKPPSGSIGNPVAEIVGDRPRS